MFRRIVTGLDWHLSQRFEFDGAFERHDLKATITSVWQQVRMMTQENQGNCVADCCDVFPAMDWVQHCSGLPRRVSILSWSCEEGYHNTCARHDRWNG